MMNEPNQETLAAIKEADTENLDTIEDVDKWFNLL